MMVGFFWKQEPTQKDKVKAMLAQRNVFERMVAAHRS